MTPTPAEIESKLAQLEARQAELAKIIPTLQFGSDDYESLVNEYLGAKKTLANLPAHLRAAKRQENREIIALRSTVIAEAIQQLLISMDMESLIGAPVAVLRWDLRADGVPSVVLNPIRIVRGRARAIDKPREGVSKPHKREVILPSGSRVSRTQFVKSCTSLTEAERAKKYPHELIRSKPRFERFIRSHPELAGARLNY